MKNRSQVNNKSAVLQMAFVGVVAITIGIFCMLDCVVIYGLPVITSISASATTGNMTGMLLPFALGCIFTYCISYVGYSTAERRIVNVMGVCFLVVALQMCNSVYITQPNVGVFGLTPETSNILHMIGAIGGFGLMWVWVTFFFTRTNPECSPTRRKKTRNIIYYTLGLVMLFGVLLLIIGAFGAFNDDFPHTWLAEEILLLPAGVALLIKSGVFMAD